MEQVDEEDAACSSALCFLIARRISSRNDKDQFYDDADMFAF